MKRRQIALEPGVRLAKLNTEEEQQIGAQFDIRSIPTLVLFKNGKEIARQSGRNDGRTDRAVGQAAPRLDEWNT